MTSRRPAGNWIDDADPLARLLWRQSDVLTRDQALRFLTPATIKHRLASGRWRRVHLGVYLTHTGPVTTEQRWWIARLAAGRSAFLAGITALRMCGLLGQRDDRVHLLIPAGSQERNPPAGVVVHRTRRLARSDVNLLGLPPHTTAARSLVDAAQWAHGDDQARAIIAAGFQQRLVAGDDVHRVLRRLIRVRRRALILEAASDAQGGAHSLPEGEFLRLLRTAGLPLPKLQALRRDAESGVRYLDGYYEEWGLHVEIDGAQHLEPRQYWADMNRQNAVWIAGDRILRFPSWAIRHRPREVEQQIRTALLAAGWRPSRGGARAVGDRGR